MAARGWSFDFLSKPDSARSGTNSFPTTLGGQLWRRAGPYGLGLGLLVVYQWAQYWFDTRLMAAIDQSLAGQRHLAIRIGWELVGVVLVAFVVRVGSRGAIFEAGRTAEYELRRELLAKLHTLGETRVNRFSPGDLLSRATNDLTQVRLLLGFGVLNIANTVIALVSALAVTLAISVPLTLASLCSLPGLLLATRWFARRIYLRTRENQVALGELSDVTQQSLLRLRVTRAFGAESHEQARFEGHCQRVQERSLALARLRGAMGPLLQAISATGVVIVFWYGGHLLLSDRLTEGGLLAFLRALTRLTWPLTALGYLVSMVQRGRAAQERLAQVFSARPEIAGGSLSTGPGPRPSLTIRGLRYQFEGREVLNLATLDVAPGERLAIMGPTGCGKTVLGRLIARTLPTPRGTVFINGHDVCSLSLTTLRASVLHVPEVAFLFSTSVQANLTYALADSESDDAAPAARDLARFVELEGDIASLPQGYLTSVGERGVQLSGGQRQRVALGRALLHRASVLILDDPTSAIDVETEARIIERLKQRDRQQTLILVTHRTSVASSCDRVLVLDRGKLLEHGSPRELGSGSGWFARRLEEQRPATATSPELPSIVDAGLHPAPSAPRGEPPDPPLEPALLALPTAPTTPPPVARGFDGRNLARLLPFLKDDRRWMVWACVLIIIAAAAALLRPLVMRSTLDEGVVHHDPSRLLWGGVLVAGLACAEQLLGFAHNYTTQVAVSRGIARLRNAIFAFLQRLPTRFFDKEPAGRLVTRITNDPDAIQEVFSLGILGALGDVLRLFCIVLVLLSIDMRLSLAAFAAAPLALGLVLLLRRPTRQAFREIRSRTARLTGALHEQLMGLGTILAFGQTERAATEFDGENQAFRRANIASIRYEALQDAAIESVGSLCLASTVLVWGAQPTSFGTLLAFQVYLMQFFEPISHLAQRYTLLQSALAGAERIFGLLDRTERDAPALERPPPSVIVSPATLPRSEPTRRGQAGRPLLEFDRVDFGYEPNATVITGFSLGVAQGEHVALVGPTGSGKSTLIALLLRLYEIQGGALRVAGRDVRDWDVAELRAQFALVPQDPQLMAGTLASNIAMRQDPDLARVGEVLKKLGIVDHLTARPLGLEAPVDSDGANFSIGERQLIALARALYRDAPILVLDEATASIDSATELRLRRAITVAQKGRTALVVAHRLGTIQSADRIIVLKKGALVEQGTHAALMQAQGLYARLVTASLNASAPSSAPD